MDLAAQRQCLERERRARLRDIGVSDEAVIASELCPIGEKPSDCVRVMTWNLLADGMSDDGFLVNDVLKDWPAGRGNVPTADGEVVKFETLLEEMIAARGHCDALEKLKSRYDVPLAEKNAEVIVDWPARELQIQLQVMAAGRPDLLVFQECDHFSTLRQGLAKLGYRSCLPSTNEVYEPAHLFGYNDCTPEGALEFQQAMEKKGYAFLPNLYSTSMYIQLNSKENKEKVIAAARSLGIQNEVIEGDHISRRAFCGHSSRRLLGEAQIDSASIDDDGVAIFWRADRFDATSLRVRLFPGGHGGALQIRLRERSFPSRDILVMGAHLGSGDDLKDEEKRLTKQVDVIGGLREMAQEAHDSCNATVLCLDANSHPQIRPGNSCWCSLHRAMGASVWDAHFDAAGNPLLNSPPVTSNKLRGPLSGQAKKIGLHSFYCIDHIFFNPAEMSLQGHPLPPRQFPSDVAAREVLNPSLSNPSDHYPIIADLAWPLKGSAARLRVAAGRSESFYVHQAVQLIQGSEDREPVRQLYISALGSAISKATNVAHRVAREGYGSIDRIQTDFPELPRKSYQIAKCPQIVILLQA